MNTTPEATQKRIAELEAEKDFLWLKTVHFDDKIKSLEQRLKIATDVISKTLEQCGSLHKPIYFIWLREALSQIAKQGDAG